MSMSLTPRQLDLLRFIHGYQLANLGASPTMDQCLAGLGLKRRSGVHRLMMGLEERGGIRRAAQAHNGAPRTIEVLTPPLIPMLGAMPLYAISLPCLSQARH